jgi:predicted RNase H-related nuclease YkuK (DUF458 family)
MENWNWKNFKNEIIPDLGEYVKDYVKKFPDVTIYCGVDSDNQGRKTSIGEVVCFRHPRKGVHVIKNKYKIDHCKDIFTKIWAEVEAVYRLGEYLEEHLSGVYRRKIPGKKLAILHVDVNPSKYFKSNKAYEASKGYLQGCGYEIETKPNAWAASYAADHVCR